MNRLIVPGAILAALILSILAFGLPLADSLRLMVTGAFGGELGISRSLVRMTPLLLAGLGMVIAWRAGLYNIGGEGQLLLGALGAATCAKFVAQVSPTIAIPTMIAGAILGGGGLAVFAAWLQIRRGVPLVIGTILLNFIAIQLLKWAVSHPLRQSGAMTITQTDPLPITHQLFQFRPGVTDLHLGVVLSILIALGCGYVLWRTKWGFSIRLVGANPRLAKANGYPVERIQYGAMALSGALCGLAGAFDYMGITGVLDGGFSQNYGFMAIPVALVGGLNPYTTLASALLFGSLFSGTEYMARLGSGSTTMVYVIQAAAVIAYVLVQQRRKREVESAD